MDGQTYAVAEYENQQNHAKNLNTYIWQTIAPKVVRRFRRRPAFGASIPQM